MIAPKSPAETLRSAAKLMRERAQAASPGPWRVSFMDGVLPVADRANRLGAEPHRRADASHGGRRLADATWTAGMHPVVGLTLADLLDRVAWMVKLDGELAGRVGVDETLAVARAYLGEPRTEGDRP